METPGKELIPQSFFFREHMKETFRSADLTLILNSHGTAEHAEQSVAIVEPGSAVFIEGFTSTPDAETDLQYLLKGLSAALCIYGAASEEYGTAKQAALDIINSYAFQPARKLNDFHVSQCREIALLIEKDCFVTFADYDQNGVRKESPVIRSSRNQAFQKLHNESSAYPILDYGVTHHSLAKTIIDMRRAERSDFLKHFHRENFAVNNYFENLVLINNAPKGHELAHTVQGKIKAYIIYGTAHQNSLATRLAEWGAPEPTIHAMHTLHESEYIPADADAYMSKIRQNIALNAFRSIGIMGGQDYESWTIFREELYKPLESLNDNPEDYVRILCEFLEIIKTNNTDGKLANLRINNMYGRIVEGNL